MANYSVDIVSSDPTITAGLAVIPLDVAWGYTKNGSFSEQNHLDVFIAVSCPEGYAPATGGESFSNTYIHGDIPYTPNNGAEGLTQGSMNNHSVVANCKADVFIDSPCPEALSLQMIYNNAPPAPTGNSLVVLTLTLGS